MLLLFVFVSGCSDERAVAPDPSDSSNAPGITIDPDAVAMELVSRAGWAVTTDEELPAKFKDLQAASPAGNILTVERQVIVDDIVHYSFQVRVGCGPYDVIGLHRVVKEKKPGTPIKAKENFFFQHGCCKDFVGMMLPGLTSAETPDDFGLAVYLARNGVDVWGIDQAWTLVPKEETNFDFMADWGIARQSDDLRTAVTAARVARIVTGCGSGKMILAGYSNGGFSTVALVNEETQLPENLRQVGGYVIVDMALKTDNAALREFLLGYLDGWYIPQYAAGNYAEPNTFPVMAELVRCCPDDPSPFYPDLTNLQYALVANTSPWVVTPETAVHYWSPILDETGMPTGLRYTDHYLWLGFMASGVPWEPMVWGLEWFSYLLDRGDSLFDDHLGEIQIPVLNLTPLGGFAYSTEYGMSMIGSPDKQTLMPGMGLPLAEEFAHIDLFTSTSAEQIVWQPLLGWINAHTEHRHGKGDVTMK